VTKSEKPSKAFSFSAIAGILILGNALLLGVVTRWFIGIMPTLPGSSGNDPMLFYTLTAVGLVLGLIILFGAIMRCSKPASKKAWGIMIIVLSILSVIMGGGFIIGFILGIIGGAKEIKRKNEKHVTKPLTATT
jgi:Family of unknown function (DUF6114)